MEIVMPCAIERIVDPNGVTIGNHMQSQSRLLRCMVDAKEEDNEQKGIDDEKAAFHDSVGLVGRFSAQVEVAGEIVAEIARCTVVCCRNKRSTLIPGINAPLSMS
jgi:hypothetical protein